VVITGCAHASAPKPSAPAHPECRSGDLAACERAILRAKPAELGVLLHAYDAARGTPGWRQLFDALRGAGDVPVVAHASPTGPEVAGARRVRLPAGPAPSRATLAELLLALGRNAGAAHVVLVAPEATHLFPRDPLAPFALGLDAELAAEATSLAEEVAVHGAIGATFAALARGDYAAALAARNRLADAAQKLAPRSETASRARYALALGARAALGEPPPLSVETAAPSTAYAALLAVETATDRAAAWRIHRARVVAGVDPARAALLDRRYAPASREGSDAPSCPPPLAPPMERVGDILFAGELARALDTTSPPREGALALGPWLERYDALVRMVEATGTGWAVLPELFSERGDLGGLTAEGSSAYRRVSDLAVLHLAALRTLADVDPRPVRARALAGFVGRRGIARDPRVLGALRGLIEHLIGLEVPRPPSSGAALEAAVAIFALGLSSPPELAAAQLGALARALRERLDGPLGREAGWATAGLSAGEAALATMMGERPLAFAPLGERLAPALAPDGVSHPALARLVLAVTHYAGLADSGASSPEHVHPKLVTAGRRAAREALRDALLKLADGGPTTPAERDLGDELASFADAFLAVAVAHLRAAPDAPALCPGARSVPRDAPLRGSFDRLQKSRKTLLGRLDAARGSSPWLRRARLCAAVLSDALDALDRRQGALAFALAAPAVEAALADGLSGWIDHPGADLARALYLMVRAGALGEPDPSALRRHAFGAIGALGAVLGSAAPALAGAATPLFTALSDAGATDEKIDLSRALLTRAESAYANGATAEGDVLVLAALGLAVARREAPPPAALALARAHQRPVDIVALLHAERQGGAPPEPSSVRAAAEALAKRTCAAPSARAVLAEREAAASWRAGRRTEARASLDKLLADAEQGGLAVPRAFHRYEQRGGETVLKLEQSVSLGGHLLHAAGALQLGLGFVPGAAGSAASLDAWLAEAAGTVGAEEAARFYAHLALVTAVLHWLDGDASAAARAARRGRDAWAHGVRLGDAAVPAPARPGDWTHDARATLLVAGQLAAEAGQATLAGDLWTLLRTSLPNDLDDAAAARLAGELPPLLRGVGELEAALRRAAPARELLAAPLPCTRKHGDPDAFRRSDCARYPVALALRMADALPTLPRLGAGAEIGKPGCARWRAVDALLAGATEGRYEPDRLVGALDALSGAPGASHDAAWLLVRYRGSKDCTPALVQRARSWAAEEALGVHVRADLLAAAVNCEGAEHDVADLGRLLARHARPERAFELLVYAARLAIEQDRPGALGALTAHEGFFERWAALGPELASAALVLEHAAPILAGRRIDLGATLPHFRLLCATLPAPERGSRCNTVSILRGDAAISDKKRAARQALADFVRAALAPSAPAPQGIRDVP
jgi:hypothetical protein